MYKFSNKFNSLVIFVNIKKEKYSFDFDEYRSLSLSIDLNVLRFVFLNLSIIYPKNFIGNSKCFVIKKYLDFYRNIEYIVFNFNLTASQQHNLEMFFGCKIIDYSCLILEIFSKRAITFEGKLQVELAKLKYFYARLIHTWRHLERQKGGIGIKSGPGEKQLEIDRRIVFNKIKKTEFRINKLKNSRDQNRTNRFRNNIPVISLVGYTNAGKSSLFNLLSNSNVLSNNKLFTTLDPISKPLFINGFGYILLIDTVGFIKEIPKELIYAFRVTLEEIKKSDLLLNVIDFSDHFFKDKEKLSINILKDICFNDIPILNIYNKVDLIDNFNDIIDSDFHIFISTYSGYGIDNLLSNIKSSLLNKYVCKKIKITYNDLKFRSYLYNIGCVNDEFIDNDGSYILNITLNKIKYNSIFKKYNKLNILC